jgi:hypothetical protein
MLMFKYAIGRWNMAAADSLPRCMRSCYMALYTVTNEITDMVEKEHGLNHVNHLRKAVCYQIVLPYICLFNFICINSNK